MKAIIGITSNFTYQGTHPEAEIDTVHSPAEYAEAITQAGGIPFIIPFQCHAEASDYIGLIDGLILSGGADISPHLYGEDPHPKLGAVNTPRDEWEMKLLEAAYDSDVPVLGICRGMQMMNVWSGGDLYQDLASQKESVIQHIQRFDFHHPAHQIMIKGGSWLDELYGEQLMVNTYHHQAVKNVAKDFKVTAMANDGVIEAMEWNDSERVAYAVQWHPELLCRNGGSGQKIFDDFVAKCTDSRDM